MSTKLKLGEMWLGRQYAQQMYERILGQAAAGTVVPLITSQQVRDNRDGTARLRVTGPIDSWFGFDFAAAVRELDAIRNLEHLDVVISSPGGHLFDALALYGELTAMRRDGVSVHSEGRGIVASAAVFPLIAASKRALSVATEVMVHYPSIGLVALINRTNMKQTFKRTENFLKAGESAMLRAYKDAGVSDKDAKSFLENEIWMSPEQAIAYGLATSVVGAPSDEGGDDDGATAIVNGVSDEDMQLIKDLAAARASAMEGENE